MADRTDPRHAQLDVFEQVITAYAERLGIEFEMDESVRSDLLRQAETEPIEDIIQLATETLCRRFDAVCSGAISESDEVVGMDIEIDDEDKPLPRMH